MDSMTLQEAATRHGVSAATLRRGIRRGDLVAQVGDRGRYEVRDADVAAFLGPKSQAVDYSDDLLIWAQEMALARGPVSPVLAGQVAGVLVAGGRG